MVKVASASRELSLSLSHIVTLTRWWTQQKNTQSPRRWKWYCIAMLLSNDRTLINWSTYQSINNNLILPLMLVAQPPYIEDTITYLRLDARNPGKNSVLTQVLTAQSWVNPRVNNDFNEDMSMEQYVCIPVCRDHVPRLYLRHYMYASITDYAANPYLHFPYLCIKIS